MLHLRRSVVLPLLTAFLLMAAVRASSQTVQGPGLVTLSGSFQEVGNSATGHGPYVSQSTLTAEQQSESINVVVSLPFRNMGELVARVSNHEQLSVSDLDNKYLPLGTTYNQVAEWLSSHGLSVQPEDPNHMLVSAFGPVQVVAAAFHTTFARVTTAKGEFTSAIVPPSIPINLSGSVLGISGLQPHLIADHALIPTTNLKTSSNPSANPPTYTSASFYMMTGADIRALYNTPSNLTGSGQTVAILMDAPFNGNGTDLNYFNTYTGNSWSGTFTDIDVGTPVPSGNNSNGGVYEAAIDVEAVASVAPAANIRLYTIPSLSIPNIEAGLNQILTDIRNHVTVSVISMSFAGAETSEYATSDLQTLDQIFLATTAVGVTNLASSGDNGYEILYNGSYIKQVAYPASDPYVTAVGGTNFILTSLSPSRRIRTRP
jgi:kumamolisin